MSTPPPPDFSQKRRRKFASKKTAIALIAIVLVSVPAAFFGILYYQMTNLQAKIELDLSQAADWVMAILNRQLPSITVKLVLTNPTSFTVDISDLYAQIYVEDEFACEVTIDNLFVPGGKTMHKDLTFSLTEGTQVYSAISNAINTYGGEVKIGLGGHLVAHEFLLSLRIPFYIEQYVMARDGSLAFESAEWANGNGDGVSSAVAGTNVCVKTVLQNPTRNHSVNNTLIIEIRRDIALRPDETVKKVSVEATLPANTSKTYTVDFVPSIASRYHFDIFLGDRKVYSQPNESPPRLQVNP
jgi:hypothetical protein